MRMFSSVCFSPVGVWVLRLGVGFGVHAASVVAAGMRCGCQCRLRYRLGWCTRRALMARRAFIDAGAHGCVLCCGGDGGAFPVVVCCVSCTCVPLLTVVCVLCSSYLYSGCFCATPDAYSALCLVLHCSALLDVSKHSLEWHSSTITKIFPSSFRNALV